MRRPRVLLHAVPLLDLRGNHRSVEPDTPRYDFLTLAIGLFDLIIERNGMEDEVDHDSAVILLEPLLTAMDIANQAAPDAIWHRRTVDQLLAALRNDACGRQSFELSYLNIEEGRAFERALPMKLLYEYHRPDGRDVLRLSDEAVNLYLNAIDLSR